MGMTYTQTVIINPQPSPRGFRVDRFEGLQAYIRIVELGTFTAAARDLRLRQATVSRWIAELEDELGVQLLDRTTRTVRVTAAGERFYERARELMLMWDHAVSQVQLEHGEVAGKLRVSAPVVFGRRFLTPHISKFLDAYPNLELEVQFSDRYVDLVEEGVDVALRVGTPQDSDYRSRTLATTPRRLVASRTYLDAHGTPKHPYDLSSHTCLLHSGIDNRVTWQFHRGDELLRVDVGGRFRANHSETLLEVCKQDHGIALLASWLVDAALARGELVEVLSEFEAPKAPIQALFASKRHTPSNVEAFVVFLQEVFGEV